MKMKTTLVLLAAAGALALTGCQPEQSELDFSSLTEKATVSGQIVYDAGVDTTSTNGYQVNLKPAAQRAVYVDIPYSAFKSGAQGNKRFETLTDNDGRYSIEVPTKPQGITGVTVRMQEFTAYKSEYLKMENGKPVFETSLYNYSWEQTGITLKPGAIELTDETQIKCTAEKAAIDELKEQITLRGNIQLAQEAGYRHGVYVPAANMTVEFTAEYDAIKDAGGVNNKPFTFGTSTDAQGNYEITLPLKSYEEGFAELSVAVKNNARAYTHYTAAGTSTTVKGYYQKQDILPTTALTGIVEGMEYELKTMYLKFTPGFNNDLTTTAKPLTWSDNLAGWERYDGYTEYKTVTGKYLLGIENGFATGSYGNPYQEACLQISYPANSKGDRKGSKTVLTNTDAEGNFSFEVPVTEADESGISVSFMPLTNQKHTHYFADGTTKTIKGSYTKNASTIKEDGAEWNEPGEQYYLFAPSTAPEDWTGWLEQIAGWMTVDARRPEYTEQTVSGTLKIAQETGYYEGVYANAAHTLVKIKCGDLSFVGITDNTGKYSIPVVIAKGTDHAVLTVTPYFAEQAIPYTHYTQPNKGTEEEVRYGNGSFTTGIIAGYTPWHNTGTTYYYSPYEQTGLRLIGWVNTVNKELWGYTDKITINAKITKAIEKVNGSTIEAAWTTDGTVRGAEISINGKAYKAPIKGNNIVWEYYVSDASNTTSLSIGIRPESGHAGKAEAFTHYPDPAKTNERTTIYGYYESAENLYDETSYSIENGKIAIEASAKMLFIPTVPTYPDGWGAYTWDVTQEP